MRAGKRKSDSRSSGAGQESTASTKSTSNRLSNPVNNCKNHRQDYSVRFKQRVTRDEHSKWTQIKH